MRKNKKAIIAEVLFIAVAMFVLAVTILLVGKVLKLVNTSINATSSEGTGFTNLSKNMSQRITNKFTPIFNSSYLIILVGLTLGAGFGAFYIRSHPAFFIVIMFVLAILTIINMAFANIWVSLTSMSQVAGEVDNLRIIDTIILNYPTILLVIGLLLGLVMYFKPVDDF